MGLRQKAQGQPVARWLASGSKCRDEDALEIAKMLDAHGVSFEPAAGARGPSLLVNLSPRHLPKTIAFLATKRPLTSSETTMASKTVKALKPLKSFKGTLLLVGAGKMGGALL